MQTEKHTPADDEIVGHKTMLDGTHVPLMASEAREIWEAIEGARIERKRVMPDSESALNALSNAVTRLREEGWREGCYCPKDDSDFAVIQFGSTGIFPAFYTGTWPDGHVIVCDGVCNPAGLLWKPTANLTPAECEKLARCNEADRIMHEREIRAFGAYDQEDAAISLATGAHDNGR